MTEKKIGYAREALASDRIEQQVEMLKAAGCTEVFTDNGVEGARRDRPGLNDAMAALEAGDTLVVCTVDRLSRSTDLTLSLTKELKVRGIELEVLLEPDAVNVLKMKAEFGIDPSETPEEQFVNTVMAAARQWRERTEAEEAE